MPRKKRTPVVHPFDQLHGVDTSGLLPGEIVARGTTAAPSEVTAYYGIAPTIFQSLLDIWLQRTSPEAPIEKTVFYDIGAGKGRAMFLASQYPFLRVEGVEFNPTLAAIARKNLEIWQTDPHSEALCPITLHEADALQHPIPAEPVVAYMYHPFGRTMTSRFLKHIDASRVESGAPFDLLYANSEHSVLLDRHSAFELLWTGKVPMSAADHVADLAEIEQQQEYGSTGDELCSIYRYTGRKYRYGR